MLGLEHAAALTFERWTGERSQYVFQVLSRGPRESRNFVTTTYE